MMRVYRVALLWLMSFVLAAGGDARAAQYIVDGDHPAAADSNSGTAEAPFLTLARGVAELDSGDELVVQPGEYSGRVTGLTALQSGSAGEPTVVRSAVRHGATIAGADLTGADHVRLEGFRISSEGDAVTVGGDHVEVVGNLFFEVRDHAVLGAGGDAAKIIGNRIYRSRMGITAVGTGWLIEDNEIEELVAWKRFGDADYARFFGSGHVFRGNRFHGTQLARMGEAHVDGFQTFGGGARNIVIENNYVEGFHQGVMAEVDRGSFNEGIVIQNNIFLNGPAWGVNFKNRSRGIVIRHNLFGELGWHGVGLREGSSAVVENNIFWNRRSNSKGTSYWVDASSELEAANNLVYHRRAPERAVSSDLVHVDPGFVDAAAGDFRLAPGSAAIDAGAASGLNYDMRALPRPMGAGPDIGPYEFQGGPDE